MISSTLTERSVAWDYDASVARVRPMVVKWGTLTVELLHELCQARAALSRTGRPESGTNVSLRTWGRYCLDIGLEKRTVNRWLLRYDDDTRTVKELPEPEPVREPEQEPPEPEAQRESVVDTEPPKAPVGTVKRAKLEPERQAKVDKFKARIAREERNSAVLPDDDETSSGDVGDLIRRIDDQILKMQEAARRFSHLALSGGSDNEVQDGMLELLQRYVQSFQPVERQVEVAHNLIKALRLIVHRINGEEATA